MGWKSEWHTRATDEIREIVRWDADYAEAVAALTAKLIDTARNERLPIDWHPKHADDLGLHFEQVEKDVMLCFSMVDGRIYVTACINLDDRQYEVLKAQQGARKRLEEMLE
jgi:hypothetical protein